MLTPRGSYFYDNNLQGLYTPGLLKLKAIQGFSRLFQKEIHGRFNNIFTYFKAQ